MKNSPTPQEVASQVRTIGIVGCGVIGASWAAYYLARGFDVIATDPAADAEQKLRDYVRRFWPALGHLGLAPGASQDRLRFVEDVAGLAPVDFVQENGPERVDVKRALLEQITSVVRNDVIIATSSSGILISDIQGAAKKPARVLLGHPFNPPHLIPLVEVVGGKETSADCIAFALAFYAFVGKKPIHIKQEVAGHVANRLQAALWREAFYLIDKGIVSVADVDTAIAHGPGLRWALLGPFMNLHLSGGEGGIGHVIDHLGPPIESWWADLGNVALDADVKEKAMLGIADELAGTAIDDVETARDEVLLTLLAAKSSSPLLK